MSCCARAQTDSSRYEAAYFVANHYEYYMYQQGPQPVRHLCWHIPYDPVGGEVDPDLKTVHSSVLPICNICKSHGAKIVVGRYGKNGRTIEESLDKKRRAEAAKAAKAAE